MRLHGYFAKSDLPKRLINYKQLIKAEQNQVKKLMADKIKHEEIMRGKGTYDKPHTIFKYG